MPYIIVRNVFIFLMVCLLIADYFLEVHWGLYLLLLAPFLIFTVIASAVMKLNIFIPAYTEPDGVGKRIAITFDDGPVPNTNAVLDVLDRYQARATFFCIGKNIEAHPDILKRIKAGGHEIGNHSYSHSYFFSFFSKKKIIEEIEHANKLLKNITGLDCDLFRPPYGVMNPPIAKAVSQKCMKVIGWNLRSFDTSTKDHNKVIRRIKRGIKPGAVILLHDDRQNTPAILEAVLNYARQENYECVDVKTIFGLQ